jgi:pilus assembly protein CpaE
MASAAQVLPDRADLISETMPQLPNRSLNVVWKPMVVCPQPDFYRRMQGVLTELALEQPCTLAEYPRSGTIGALAERHACNICFIDVATDAEHAQSLISELAPSVPVVALHPRNDADLILRCLRRGACEFIADPTADALGAVFERLGRTRLDAAHHVTGTLYCVVPGKPGCGASTLAAHLAVQLRMGGANPVLLVDGDPLTASIAFMLKLKPQFHLEDVMRDWARMDDDVWSRLTVRAFGLDVLAAPEDPTTRTEVSRQFAGELCAFWRERYEAVVLDLPDVRAAADCGFAAAADSVLLVTTNELAALQATRRGLRYLESGVTDRAKLRLILNRATSAIGLQREDVKTALAMQPFATLSNDYETIQSAVLEGKPAPPGSRYGASVQALWEQLCHKSGPQRKSASWLTSLLRPKKLVSR